MSWLLGATVNRRSGSSIGVANALLVIGSSTELYSQPRQAIQRFEEALNIYRKQKNEAGEAAALKARRELPPSGSGVMDFSCAGFSHLPPSETR